MWAATAIRVAWPQEGHFDTAFGNDDRHIDAIILPLQLLDMCLC